MASNSSDNIRVAFFNVGGGQLIVIKTDKNPQNVWVIGAGPASSSSPVQNIFSGKDISDRKIASQAVRWIKQSASNKPNIHLIPTDKQWNDGPYKLMLETFANGGSLIIHCPPYLEGDFKDYKNKVKKIGPAEIIELSSSPSFKIQSLSYTIDAKDSYGSPTYPLILKVEFGTISLLIGGRYIQSYYDIIKNNPDFKENDTILQLDSSNIEPKTMLGILQTLHPFYEIQNKGGGDSDLGNTLSSALYFNDRIKQNLSSYSSLDQYHFLIDPVAYSIVNPSVLNSIPSWSLSSSQPTVFQSQAAYQKEINNQKKYEFLSVTNAPVFSTNSQGTLVLSWDEKKLKPDFTTFDYDETSWLKFIWHTYELQDTTSKTLFPEAQIQQRLQAYLETKQNIISRESEDSEVYPDLSIFDIIVKILIPFYQNSLTFWENTKNTISQLSYEMKKLRKQIERWIDNVRQQVETLQKLVNNITETYNDLQSSLRGLSPQERDLLIQALTSLSDKLFETIFGEQGVVIGGDGNNPYKDLPKNPDNNLFFPGGEDGGEPPSGPSGDSSYVAIFSREGEVIFQNPSVISALDIELASAIAILELSLNCVHKANKDLISLGTHSISLNKIVITDIVYRLAHAYISRIKKEDLYTKTEDISLFTESVQDPLINNYQELTSFLYFIAQDHPLMRGFFAKKMIEVSNGLDIFSDLSSIQVFALCLRSYIISLPKLTKIHSLDFVNPATIVGLKGLPPSVSTLEERKTIKRTLTTAHKKRPRELLAPFTYAFRWNHLEFILVWTKDANELTQSNLYVYIMKREEHPIDFNPQDNGILTSIIAYEIGQKPQFLTITIFHNFLPVEIYDDLNVVFSRWPARIQWIAIPCIGHNEYLDLIQDNLHKPSAAFIKNQEDSQGSYNLKDISLIIQWKDRVLLFSAKNEKNDFENWESQLAYFFSSKNINFTSLNIIKFGNDGSNSETHITFQKDPENTKQSLSDNSSKRSSNDFDKLPNSNMILMATKISKFDEEEDEKTLVNYKINVAFFNVGQGNCAGARVLKEEVTINKRTEEVKSVTYCVDENVWLFDAGTVEGPFDIFDKRDARIASPRVAENIIKFFTDPFESFFMHNYRNFSKIKERVDNKTLKMKPPKDLILNILISHPSKDHLSLINDIFQNLNQPKSKVDVFDTIKFYFSEKYFGEIFSEGTEMLKNQKKIFYKSKDAKKVKSKISVSVGSLTRENEGKILPYYDQKAPLLVEILTSGYSKKDEDPVSSAQFNDNSIIAKLSFNTSILPKNNINHFKDISVLFTGDATDVTFKDIKKNETLSKKLKSTILMASHHGAAEVPNNLENLKSIRPSYDVFSSALAGSKEHPDPSSIRNAVNYFSQEDSHPWMYSTRGIHPFHLLYDDSSTPGQSLGNEKIENTNEKLLFSPILSYTGLPYNLSISEAAGSKKDRSRTIDVTNYPIFSTNSQGTILFEWDVVTLLDYELEFTDPYLGIYTYDYAMPDPLNTNNFFIKLSDLINLVFVGNSSSELKKEMKTFGDTVEDITEAMTWYTSFRNGNQKVTGLNIIDLPRKRITPYKRYILRYLDRLNQVADLQSEKWVLNLKNAHDLTKVNEEFVNDLLHVTNNKLSSIKLNEEQIDNTYLSNFSKVQRIYHDLPPAFP